MRYIMKVMDEADDWLAGGALACIIAIIGANVFCRFVLSQPITWSEEVSLALFVWLTFIGISAVMKRNEHVGIDYFVRKLPKPFFLFVQRFRFLMLVVVTFVVFVYWGGILVIDTHWKITPVLGIDFKFIYIAIPLGGVLALYHLVKAAVKRDRSFIYQEEEGDNR
ncbi:TRAP transporter small permease [Shouchella patagoniensis]|uniref:TRAP transporter small permease n=1 Tax=Shouchella patagoniensis TaxID=228576 RepID=UPI00099580C8|nr:TRAP transporter small permease [Shouchella patagoniensis]